MMENYLMMTISPKFVDQIPRQLDDNVLYISLKYSTAVHKCFCGCHEEVVTPLSPTDWKLIFDGRTISLTPSIGNWSYKCRSHYWITKNKVIWANEWSESEIKTGRQQDIVNKKNYLSNKKTNVWSRFKNWLIK